MAPPPLRQAPELFISCAPGLEPWLQREVAALGLDTPARQDAGGVTLATGHRRTIYRANLELGVATRVLLRVGRFHCRSLGELQRKATRIPWRDWLHPGLFAVRAESRRSRLYHRDAIAERVAAAIAETLGGPAVSEGEVPPVLVRFENDECTLSLDTSGTPLHDRGYRREPGPAPLREDLARALVLASGWDAASPLLDPFAGVGTILIEAALLARKLPPGGRRGFAFERTALLDPDAWAAVRAAAEQRAASAAPRLLGSDRRPDCITWARANAERAGVGADIELAAASLSRSPFRSELAHAGAVVTDPPHGRRLGSADSLPKLYRALGAWLQAAPATCRIALLSGDRRLALRTGIPLTTAFLAMHGGVRVRALVGQGGARAGSSPST